MFNLPDFSKENSKPMNLSVFCDSENEDIRIASIWKVYLSLKEEASISRSFGYKELEKKVIKLLNKSYEEYSFLKLTKQIDALVEITSTNNYYTEDIRSKCHSIELFEFEDHIALCYIFGLSEVISETFFKNEDRFINTKRDNQLIINKSKDKTSIKCTLKDDSSFLYWEGKLITDDCIKHLLPKI